MGLVRVRGHRSPRGATLYLVLFSVLRPLAGNFAWASKLPVDTPSSNLGVECEREDQKPRSVATCFHHGPALQPSYSSLFHFVRHLCNVILTRLPFRVPLVRGKKSTVPK